MRSSNTFSPIGSWSFGSRVLFCLFWISMLAAVLFTRNSSSTNLIEGPITIDSFDLGRVLQILTALLLISSFLERAIEVYVLTFRKKDEVKIDLNIRRLKLNLEIVDELDVNGANFEKIITGIVDIFPVENEDKQKIFDKLGKPIDKTNAQNTLKEEINIILNDKDKLIDEYKNTTRSYTLWSALFLGIIISLIGVRGIGPFFPSVSGNNWESNWFKSIDIFLTGAVIAGGSDAIHKVLQVITTFMEAIATSNKAVAAANVDGTKP
jgi:hypothetical protein